MAKALNLAKPTPIQFFYPPGQKAAGVGFTFEGCDSSLCIMGHDADEVRDVLMGLLVFEKVRAMLGTYEIEQQKGE